MILCKHNIVFYFTNDLVSKNNEHGVNDERRLLYSSPRMCSRPMDYCYGFFILIKNSYTYVVGLCGNANERN